MKRKTSTLWNEYIFRRQTVSNLSESTGLSERTIRRKLRLMPVSLVPPKPDPSELIEQVALVIDTTYLERYGVMAFRCFNRRQNLLWFFVAQEKQDYYLQGIEQLESIGYNITSITCDGFGALKQAFSALGYTVQLCQFHAMKRVTKYLTRRPRLQASKELRSIMLTMTKTNKQTFENELNNWYKRWKDFLKERTIDPETNKWHYTHPRVRSAYQSLKQGLPYLFTYQDHPELNIPNTTNTLEGTFSHLKQKIRVHRGLNIHTQMKVAHTLLSRPTKKPKNN